MRRGPVLVSLAAVIAGSALFAFVLWHCTPVAPPPAPPVVLPPPNPAETAAEIVERKRLFMALLLPIIQEENRRLLVDRKRITRIELELANDDDISRDDFEWLKQMAADYDLDPAARRNTEFFNSLRRRVDMIPASLIIAQAALESGWGRSQVTREENNFFGHYCYGKDCGVPAPGSGDLRSFATPAASVHAYMHNLNSHAAYRQLRKHREAARIAGKHPAGSDLVGDIGAYSERGEAYIADVRAVIRANDLDTLPDT